MSVALALSALRVELPRRSETLTLVDEVSLSVAAGEVLGIVGETGAGKTLTTKAVLGLLPRSMRASGTLAVGDREPVALSDAAGLHPLRGRDIGLVQQNPMATFDPLFRLGAQLTEGVVRRKLLSRADARERAHQLLSQLGFRDPAATLDLYPHQLSGGMSQRMAIAMALMPRPSVIIADEPTSALDAHLRIDVLRLLRSVGSEQGAGIVLVSHDLGLVSHFCDTVAVIYAGRIVERGPIQAVLREPAHPYTVALLACSPALDAPPRRPLRAIGGTPPAPTAWPPGCVFAPRCPRAAERCHVEPPALTDHGGRIAACHFPFGRPA
jgi:oligopeptide/dipeptide ABC transporter ATP-binding protein